MLSLKFLFMALYKSLAKMFDYVIFGLLFLKIIKGGGSLFIIQIALLSWGRVLLY